MFHGIKRGNPCLFTGCSNKGEKRGYCGAHYRQLHRGKNLTSLKWTKKISKERKGKECSFNGCTQRCLIIGDGLCRGHYRQKQKGKELKPLIGSVDFKFSTSEYHRKNRRIQNARYYYGISEEQLNYLLKIQEGKCAICKVIPNRTLHIDHDHETGKVRGLLCDKCNRGLGYFDDNMARISAAYHYLVMHNHL